MSRNVGQVYVQPHSIHCLLSCPTAMTSTAEREVVTYHGSADGAEDNRKTWLLGQD